MKASPITPPQWKKVLQALYYSFGSGFAGGLTLAATGVLTGVANGAPIHLNTSIAIALVVGGVVGGLNTLAVTVKQLFTPGTV